MQADLQTPAQELEQLQNLIKQALDRKERITGVCITSSLEQYLLASGNNTLFGKNLNPADFKMIRVFGYPSKTVDYLAVITD